MKKIGLLLLSLGFFAASCSSDDSESNNNNGAATTFLPLDSGNYWVYNVNSPTLGNGRDSLYVANDTVIGVEAYKKLKTKFLPNGFFSGALNNNAMRVSGDELVVSGEVTVPFSEDFPVNIAIYNFTIFKESAAANTVLDSETGTMTQEYEGYPLDFDYTLTTKAIGNLATHTANGVEYTNVKQVETTLVLKISASIEGIPIPITILPEQNVVTSNQYYAEGIGVVDVATTFQYQLSEIPGLELPIPQSASESQQEVLVDYSVE